MLIMLIRKIAQGWQGGNQAELSYISIYNRNQSKNMRRMNFARSTQFLQDYYVMLLIEIIVKSLLTYLL